MDRDQKLMDAMTTKEVAKIMRCHPRTVLRLAAVGKLDAYRVPGSRKALFPRSQFQGCFEKLGK